MKVANNATFAYSVAPAPRKLPGKLMIDDVVTDQNIGGYTNFSLVLVPPPV